MEGGAAAKGVLGRVWEGSQVFCGITDFTGPEEAEATARVSGGKEGGGSPSMGGGQELQSWAGA